MHKQCPNCTDFFVVTAGHPLVPLPQWPKGLPTLISHHKSHQLFQLLFPRCFQQMYPTFPPNTTHLTQDGTADHLRGWTWSQVHWAGLFHSFHESSSPWCLPLHRSLCFAARTAHSPALSSNTWPNHTQSVPKVKDMSKPSSLYRMHPGSCRSLLLSSTLSKVPANTAFLPLWLGRAGKSHYHQLFGTCLKAARHHRTYTSFISNWGCSLKVSFLLTTKSFLWQKRYQVQSQKAKAQAKG